MSGPGKRFPLVPVPKEGAAEQSRLARTAGYDQNRLNNIELERLRKQRDSIVGNLKVDETQIIGEINLLQQERIELQKLKPQVASLEKIKNSFLEEDIDAIILAIESKDAQIAKLPALQQASDTLDAVILNLGFGVTKASDIVAIVGKHVTDNLAFRKEIVRLTALTTEQDSAIDGYIETAREQTTALGLKDQEIALLQADKSMETPEIAKIKADLRESKLQTATAESNFANSERLLAALNASSTAVEATNRELTRQLGLAEAAKAVTAKQIDARDEYITALSKSIGDMNFVLDKVLTHEEATVDAAQMVVHRPVLVDGDPFKQSSEAVVVKIDAFEADLKYVRYGVQALDQKPFLNAYIADLSKSIIDMNRVINDILSEHDVDADSMKIYRPALVVPGDALKQSHDLVLKTIDGFEKDMDHVRAEKKQKTVLSEYITALGDVIIGMRTMSSTFDGLVPMDKVKIPLLSAIDNEITKDHKTQMLTSIDAFEKALHGIKVKYDLLTGDKKVQGEEIVALKGALAAENKNLNGNIDTVQAAADILKGEKAALITRATLAEKALEALQRKYDTESKALGKLMDDVGRPGNMPAAGKDVDGASKDSVVRDRVEMPAKESVPRPLSDVKLNVGSSPPPRARISDKPADGEHDPSLTARTYASSSSSGTSHHEHVDDRLVMALLDRLQELVGPHFGVTDKDLREGSCDAIGMILAGVLGEFNRFQLMHHIFPRVFPMSKSHDFIREETVSEYISRYLKVIWNMHAATAPSESRHDFLEREWPSESREEKETETERPRDRIGARTERPANGRNANLSTPIANLLIDLRTMHDDM